MPQELSIFTDTPLSLVSLLISLGIGAVLSLLVQWHYRRFGSTLSNRDEFASVFPFILLTTILIISVVKSSLALSLGLVGALSIVRFRTPIKEPEELAYLFVSIAIGLGLGAQQIAATVVSSVFILFIMALLKWRVREAHGKHLYLSIDWNGGDESDAPTLERMNEVLTRHVRRLDLRRYDVRSDTIEATYILDLSGTDNLSVLTDEMMRTFPGIGVVFLDQSKLPSI